jgi:uncharacterized membrane protein YdbT with pleckstrin-like domain
METRTFRPDIGYARKQRLVLTLIALGITAMGLMFGLLIGIDEGPEVTVMIFTGFVIAAIVFWLVAMLLVGPYYRSLSYEVQDDEVIVRVGIWTKSVKHVPYRTVTNVTIKRGILDRYLFNLGTLNIQTAGMSGTTGAEESLVGLANVQDVYDIVVQKLRLFRGGMAPTAAEQDQEYDTSSGHVMNEILNELRAIRRNTET